MVRENDGGLVHAVFHDTNRSIKGDIAGIQIDALFFGEIRKEIRLLGRHLV